MFLVFLGIGDIRTFQDVKGSPIFSLFSRYIYIFVIKKVRVMKSYADCTTVFVEYSKA